METKLIKIIEMEDVELYDKVFSDHCYQYSCSMTYLYYTAQDCSRPSSAKL